MITLYQFAPSFGLPVSVSPFCAKLELYLRLTGRDYVTAAGDVREAPNGTVPYVRWPDDTIQGESDDIIARLEAEGPALDAGLAESERARGRELQALAEDIVYYACLYARFVEPAGWAHQKAAVRALLPVLLAPVLMPVIRRSQRKRCRDHGFVDVSGYARAEQAVAQLDAALSDQDYLLGDTPRVTDCAVWANLLATAFTSSDNAGRAAVRARPRLMAYLPRLAARGDLSLPE